MSASVRCFVLLEQRKRHLCTVASWLELSVRLLRDHVVQQLCFRDRVLFSWDARFQDRVCDGDQPAGDGELCGLPLILRCLATNFRTGLLQAAASTVWNKICRNERRPPAIVCLPRIAPLSCGTGARPVMPAASPDVIRPSSGISAIIMTAETRPLPGIDRRSLAFAAEVSSCAMTLSIRRSRSPTCVSSMVRWSASMLSTSAGMACFLRAAICAQSRLRMSTVCVLRVVNALRIRKFAVGSRRPASGRNSMNRALSSASIRSVFARVPQERAKALISAGGNWPASISAATNVAQSADS